MFCSRASRSKLRSAASIVVAAPLILIGCGGGGDDGPNPRHDLQPILDALDAAEADNQRLQEQLDQAEEERQRLETEANQPQLDPEPDADTETDAEEEVPNPYGIVDEPWVWHDGRYIPLSQVPVEESLPEATGWDVYLPWSYHASPSIHTFGPWDDATTTLVELPHATFGVTLRDGAYVPWMQGELPLESLYANSDQVQRTFDEYGYFTIEYSDLRWSGSLVGATPSGESVTGNATLSDFDFGGYRHRGKGTERLRYWDPGKAYLTFTGLAYGDGSTWGDGDLEYEVGLGRTFAGGGRLHDNSFSHPFRQFSCTRHPSGCSNDSLSMAAGVRPEGYATSDAGEVRGMFFGPSHETMAGTLQREDLTAAFGGER